MKKIISIASISLLICVVFMFTASSQQGKANGNGNGKEQGNGKATEQKGNKVQKEERQNNGNQGNKNQDENNRGNGKVNDGDKDNSGNGRVRQGDNKNEGKSNGNDNGNDKEDKNNKKYNDNGNGKGKNKGVEYYNDIFGYRWDKENFYNRKKYKSQEKVNICHKISKGNGEGVEINVSENAVKAHLNHGDVLGQCPVIVRRYSDIFYNNRQGYYNSLQNTQEQVYYSQSILDYALARLAYGKGQLVTLQNSGAPIAVIESKQQSVDQLQQNASLLETLIGAAVTVVANELL